MTSVLPHPAALHERRATPRHHPVRRPELLDPVAGPPGRVAVGDLRHVVLPVRAARLAAQPAERGGTPVPLDLSELLGGGGGGGGAECCTLEVHP